MRKQFFLHRDEFLDALVADRERAEDILFGNLDGAALDHDDGVVRSCDDNVHLTVLKLQESGIENPLALHASDAHGGDRTEERNLRSVEGERSGYEREHVGVILLIGGDD